MKDEEGKNRRRRKGRRRGSWWKGMGNMRRTRWRGESSRKSMLIEKFIWFECFTGLVDEI